MRLLPLLRVTTILGLTASTLAVLSPDAEPISQPSANDNDLSTASVSAALFSSLERLARLVDISYCVGTSGIWRPFTCASRCKDFPNLQLASTWNTGVLLSDSCGYIAVDHGSGDGKEKPAIIIAFRGTYSLANTVVDLSTVPQEYVPYPDPAEGHGGGHEGNTTEQRCANCTVHMGFLESWRQARKLILPVVQSVRAQHPDYPISLVGHSLGGAVACLAALEMKVALGWDARGDMVVTTFGEPQVGNEAFAGFVDRVFGMDGLDGYDPDLERRAYRRVTHVGDPVPLLPLREWGYQPHAGEVFIAQKELSPGVEDLRLCRGDEDPSCIAGDTEARFRLWELLFAHRDYFWRLGLCVPGSDPSDWGRPPYNVSEPDEL